MSDKITVLGLGLPRLEKGKLSYAGSPALLHPALAESDVLIAGTGQLSLASEFKGIKLPVGGDVDGLIKEIKANREKGLKQVALATGDPLFFGLGSTLTARLGPDLVRAVPAAGCLQGASAFLGFSPHEACCVSLHGPRAWSAFDTALVSGGKVFLLTDVHSHPGAVAAYMRERGRTEYSLHVLGGLHIHDGIVGALESRVLTVDEATEWQQEENPPRPRVVFVNPLQNQAYEKDVFGLRDEVFSRSDNVMTKMTARVAALGYLGIAPRHMVWDLGAGVGSVAVEASRLACRGQVLAIERDPSRVEHILENRRLMGAANLVVLEGELPYCLDPEAAESRTGTRPHPGETCLPRPDRIFIGGGIGGGTEAAEALLNRAWDALLPGGRIVIACVLLSTLERCRAYFQRMAICYEVATLQTAHGEPLGSDIYMRGANPVQFIIGYK